MLLMRGDSLTLSPEALSMPKERLMWVRSRPLSVSGDSVGDCEEAWYFTVISSKPPDSS